MKRRRSKPKKSYIQDKIKSRDGLDGIDITARDNGEGGDCFYLSVLERLQAANFAGSESMSIKTLRECAANYMLTNSKKYSDHLPYGQTLDKLARKTRRQGVHAHPHAVDALGRSLGVHIIIVRTYPSYAPSITNTGIGFAQAKLLVPLLHLSGKESGHYRSLLAVADLEKLGAMCSAQTVQVNILRTALRQEALRQELIHVDAESLSSGSKIRHVRSRARRNDRAAFHKRSAPIVQQALSWISYLLRQFRAGVKYVRRAFGRK